MTRRYDHNREKQHIYALIVRLRAAGMRVKRRGYLHLVNGEALTTRAMLKRYV